MLLLIKLPLVMLRLSVQSLARPPGWRQSLQQACGGCCCSQAAAGHLPEKQFGLCGHFGASTAI